jgi:hypothetical protein
MDPPSSKIRGNWKLRGTEEQFGFSPRAAVANVSGVQRGTALVVRKFLHGCSKAVRKASRAGARLPRRVERGQGESHATNPTTGRATLWRAPTQECRLVRERSMEAQ